MMTVNNNNKSAQELYEQFMAELDAGAKEYDSIVASGKAPAQRVTKVVPLHKVSYRRYWYAAACAVAVIMGGTYLYLGDDAETTDMVVAQNVKNNGVSVAPTSVNVETVATHTLLINESDMTKADYAFVAQKETEAEAEENVYTVELDEIVFQPQTEDVLMAMSATRPDNEIFYTEAMDVDNVPMVEDEMDYVISGKYICANCDDNSLYIREYYITNN